MNLSMALPPGKTPEMPAAAFSASATVSSDVPVRFKKFGLMIRLSQARVLGLIHGGDQVLYVATVATKP